MAWQRDRTDNRRARVEGQMDRCKPVIGDGLRFPTDAAQATEVATEVAIAVDVRNRMLALGRPNSVRLS